MFHTKGQDQLIRIGPSNTVFQLTIRLAIHPVMNFDVRETRTRVDDVANAAPNRTLGNYSHIYDENLDFLTIIAPVVRGGDGHVIREFHHHVRAAEKGIFVQGCKSWFRKGFADRGDTKKVMIRLTFSAWVVMEIVEYLNQNGVLQRLPA